MKHSLFSMRLCRDYPCRLAIVGNGESCTCEDMRRGILGLERKLREMGVKQGSRVALWSYNFANWLIAFFAIVRAGGTAVLVNYSMSSADAAGLLAMTETGFLLCGDNGATKKHPDAMRQLASMAGIPEGYCLDIRPAVLDLAHAFRDDAEVSETPDDSDENATAFIIFTSGTTSQPKAVQISQRALTFDADAFNENIGEYAGRSVCVAVPLFHILGLLMSYLTRLMRLSVDEELAGGVTVFELSPDFAMPDRAQLPAPYHLPEITPNPDGEVLEYGFRLPSEAFMGFVKANGTSPSVMLSMLVDEAIRRLHPVVDAPVFSIIPASIRRQLGCEETFKNCSSRAMLPVSGTPMDALPFAQHAVQLRTMLKQQMDADKFRPTYNMLGQMFRRRMEQATDYQEALNKPATFFIDPLMGVISGCIALLLFIFQFVLYKQVIDPLFPKREGTNVTAVRLCAGEVRQRVFLNGHMDAAWEFPLNYRFDGVVFEIPGLVTVVGVLFYIAVGLLFLRGVAWAHTAAMWGLAFVPFFVAVGFTYNPWRVVDGANDDLTGCYMGIALLRELERHGMNLKHTEVGVILTGSEEAGLRGAKAWCRAHAQDYRDVPTYIISFDTIHDPKHLMVNARDLNGTLKADQQLCEAFLQAARDVGVPCKLGWVPPFGGATDSAAFTQGDFRSVGITGLNHRLEDYYHTRRDTWDNMNREGLENCYRATLQMLHTMENKAFDRPV